MVDLKVQVLGVPRPGGRRGMARTSWVQVTLENICEIFGNYLLNICKMCKIFKVQKRKYEFGTSDNERRTIIIIMMIIDDSNMTIRF